MPKSASNNAVRAPLFVLSEQDENVCTGVQTHFLDAISFLSERGLEVSFVGPAQFKERYFLRRVLINGFARVLPLLGSVSWAAMRYFTMRFAMLELRHCLKATHSWSVYANDPVTAAAALKLRRSASQTVILAVHYNVSQAVEMTNRGLIPSDGWLFRLIRKWEDRVINNVDGVVVFSRFMCELIQERSVKSQRIEIIPNTAAVPQRNGAISLRDLIAIGSLEPRKNQQFLLRVLHEAKRRGFSYTLTVVGDGESLADLEAMALKLAIHNQVVFAGRVANAASLIPSHRMFLHAAKVDNFPIALVEALAAGVPILAPAVGGIPEIFDDGVQGKYWNLDDVFRAADILISLMECEATRQRMGTAARERYVQFFERSAVLTRLDRFLEKTNSSLDERLCSTEIEAA